MRILVTGSEGFIGKNLVTCLQESPEHEIMLFDVGSDPALLAQYAQQADFVFHLAGVNRPKNDEEFEYGNSTFTAQLLALLRDRPVPVLLSSSAQAALNNPYGVSKAHAEQLIFDYAKDNGVPVYIFRLPGVFGKWCRPNYNSVVATFCNNLAHGLPLQIHDAGTRIELAYIDDVVEALIGCLNEHESRNGKYCCVPHTYALTLGELASRLSGIAHIASTRVLPDMADPLNVRLHATYLSYVPADKLSTPGECHQDNRGFLFELLKSPHMGQIFISTTHPGIVRGNHYHHTKFEKFCVVTGRARITLRNIASDETLQFDVAGAQPQIVDIPPGYTHNIINTGATDVVTLFWASEMFDPSHPDTYACEV